jgi:trk system potassium uptake protein TrkH
MHFAMVFHIISVLIMVIGGFMFLPLGIALYNGEQASFAAFLQTIFIVLFCGIMLNLITRKIKGRQFSAKDGFLMVTVSWIIASVAGALLFTFPG